MLERELPHTQTRLFVVIGDPIAHSNSPRMHNAAYHALGLSSVMVAAKVGSDSLRGAISGVRAFAIAGLAVTMPHKNSICELIDRLDPIARTIGAVNTVTNLDGVLTGHNTDWIGIQRPLEKRGSLSTRSVAVLGAGGAAQAAVYACRMKGATVTVFSRDAHKAHALATQHGTSWGTLDASAQLSQFDIIINATPVGMGELADQSPLTISQLHNRQIVFETIYHPRQTKLLSLAKQLGCDIVYGSEMFLEQGAAQFEILTGVQAPRDVMLRALGADTSDPLS